ncbi:MAG TPA: hypothetical protein VKB75_13130 [Jatrophihabitans sp.]|nr:hypothetical protein [Jatrophihabitans sp.]
MDSAAELSLPRPSVRAMTEGRALAIAAVKRELAEMEAYDAAVEQGLKVRGSRRRAGVSMVYSVRLDTLEVDALERRAVYLGLKPSVLARNLIRIGLQPGRNEEVSLAINRLETAVEELRGLVS